MIQLGISQNNNNSAKSPEAGNSYNNGMDATRKGNHNKAVPLFKEAIQADSEFKDAYYMLGYCYRKLKNNNEAQNAFKKAIEIDSKFEKAYIALGNLQTQTESFDSAINSFNAVVAFNDKSAKAYYGLGNVRYKMKQYKQAIEHLKKATEFDSKYYFAYGVLGLSYKAERNFNDAAKAFNSAIKNSKKRSLNGTYYYHLGDIYLSQKKYNSAKTAYSNALKYSKSQTEVHKHLGQKQKALTYFKQAAKNRSWKSSADYEVDLLLNPEKYSN